LERLKRIGKLAIIINNQTYKNMEVRNEVSKIVGIMEQTHSQVDSVTPYILEEREMRVTQMDVFSRLMIDRIIWLSGPVDQTMCDIVQAQLLFLDSVEVKDITIYLNTPGGSVLNGLGILDVMNYIKSDVCTVNVGMCASMGSILLAGGTPGKRSSLRLSKVMTHQVSHGTQGNVQDTRVSHKEAEKYNYILFKLLGKYSGKTWKEVMEYSTNDRWFTSSEALEYGLIDEVIPSGDGESIDDLMKGYDEYLSYID